MCQTSQILVGQMSHCLTPPPAWHTVGWMRFRIFSGTVIRLVALLALTAGTLACHHNERPVIAVIPETTAQEVWESAHAQAARIATSWGWHTFWNGPSREDDLLRQIQIMDKEVGRGVAGIILAPDHAVALISPVRAAVAKNIPVAIIDNPLAAPPKGNVLFVLNDYAATGRFAAQRIAPHLSAKHDEVAILGVYPNFLGSLVMADALRQTLQSRSPHVRIVEQRSIFGASEADDAVNQLVQEHPSLAAIVALNVTQARSAFGALQRANLTGKVILIGCEQDFDVVYRVRTGDMDSVIAKDTGTMIRDAMEWIRSRREGKATTTTILVAPQLVTRSNVDSPEIQRVLAASGDAQ
jgi:ribose transport system substrate-binding protein